MSSKKNDKNKLINNKKTKKIMIAEKAKLKKANDMKNVYLATPSFIEGDKSMKNELGGKGANIQEMLGLSLRVPPAATLATHTCNLYYQNGQTISPSLKEEFMNAFTHVEDEMGLKFGDVEKPLLVSVRSGAKFSMPGMMDTILNVGMNDKIVLSVAKRTQNEKFAWDSYRRLIQLYGNVVHEMKTTQGSPFELLLEKLKEKYHVQTDKDLTAEQLKELVSQYKECYLGHTGEEFPQDPWIQLWECVEAVYRSWNGERAVLYRKMEGIPHDIGTAVNVQAMVFGNMGDDSLTGVGFTRDPSTGENIFFGEYLENAQGEDVVAGSRTPHNIHKLKEIMPDTYHEILGKGKLLENHYEDLMDLEFTVQQTVLWWLQCRVGKRTGFAALKVAIDLVNEGKITIDDALLRISEDHLNQVLKPIFDRDEKKLAQKSGRLVGKALNGSPGAASGQIVFYSDDAEKMKAEGKDVILMRHDTNPDDFKGMISSKAVISGKGGNTCHALVVARGKGLIAAAGIENLKIDYENQTAMLGNTKISAGDWISVDGTTGEIFIGKIKTMPSEIQQVLIEKTLLPEESSVYQNFATIMNWAIARKTMGIKANADNGSEARIARAFGAEGIGLYRTEHTIGNAQSIKSFRKLILSNDKQSREKYLEEMFEHQAQNLYDTFVEMSGLPVRVRTIDAPFHEFLPQDHDEKGVALMNELAQELGIQTSDIKQKIEKLTPVNPGSALRGCRLTIKYPEILDMQIRSMATAAHRAISDGIDAKLEIMIPNAFGAREIVWHKDKIDRIIAEYENTNNIKIDYVFAAMIECPAFCKSVPETMQKTACSNYSYGSNDLTSSVMILSREDANETVQIYIEEGLLTEDPFTTINDTVVEVMDDCNKAGAKESEKLGIPYISTVCGEAGGDLKSVIKFGKIGIDAVSASPFRIPIAILGAAQAAILN